MPTALETSSRVSPVTMPPSDSPIAHGHLAGLRRTPARSPRAERVALSGTRSGTKPSAVAPVDLAGRDRPEHRRRSPSRSTVIVIGPALAPADRPRETSSNARRRRPVDRDDHVSGLRGPMPRPGVSGDHGARPSRVTPAATPSMKTTASATIAKRRFVAGPAKMTAMRFHVGARQYASGASASSSSVRPFSALRRAGSRELGALRSRARASASAARRRRGRRARARARRALDGGASHGASSSAPAEVDVDVAGRRPVHARDLHVAAERDRRRCRTRCRSASHFDERRREEEVELPRPHPDGARGEEVPHLVDEDQEREPADRDRRGSCRETSSRVSAAAVRAGRRRRSRPARRGLAPGAPSTRGERPLDDLGDAEEAAASPSRNAATATSFAALSTHGAVPPASPASRARRRQGNASVVGRAELERQPDARSSGGIGVAARSG